MARKRNLQPDWSQRLFEPRNGAIEVACRYCGTTLYVPPSKAERRFCSMECRAKSRNDVNWNKRVHICRPGTIEKQCACCARKIWVPPSRADRKFCSHKCQSAALAEAKKASEKICATCGASFYPSPSRTKKGYGKYCSQKCNVAGKTALFSKETQEKAVRNRRAAFEAGEFMCPSGPDHPGWKGGKDAYFRRLVESGVAAKRLREYRKKNPDKVREFARRRSSRKIGRLPRGTIPAIKAAQRGKCAICRSAITDGYHIDHIIPIAKGGAHSPSNIQILCATCNLHKSDRDPIEHMRSLGRLL